MFYGKCSVCGRVVSGKKQHAHETMHRAQGRVLPDPLFRPIRTPSAKKRPPRRVNLKGNRKDQLIFTMGSLGLHGDAIAEKTGDTRSRVEYRLAKWGVKRRDYRDGKGLAKALLSYAERMPELQQSMRKTAERFDKLNGHGGLSK